jgi:hypothetical protein
MEVLGVLILGFVMVYLVVNWIARLRWMHSYPLARIEVLKGELESLRREADYFKDEMRRSQVAKMYIRAGASIFAKAYVDRAGNVLVTDNLFCRMLSDGLLKKPTGMQFLPDALRGLLVLKFGSSLVASYSLSHSTFTVERLKGGDLDSSGSTFFRYPSKDPEIHSYRLRLQTAPDRTSAGPVQLDIMIRTGVPNDYA